MTIIQAGSKVKAIRSVTRIFEPCESIEAGKVYTVARVVDGDEVFLEGYTQYFNMTRFELVDDVEFEGFRVGDRVEVIYGGAGVSSRDLGKEAVVVAVNPAGDFYGKLVIDGSNFVYSSYHDKTAIKCATKSVKKLPPKLDLNKPLFTAEGTPVEVVTTEGRDEKFPILAYEGKAKSVSKFSRDGISSLGVARRNLTNVAPKPEPITATRYINLYDDGTTGLFVKDSRADADKTAIGNSRKRIGVAKVVLVEGQFDE